MVFYGYISDFHYVIIVNAIFNIILKQTFTKTLTIIFRDSNNHHKNCI